MYGIFTNIYPKNHPNVGNYTIHGAYGINIYIFHISTEFHGCPISSAPSLSLSAPLAVKALPSLRKVQGALVWGGGHGGTVKKSGV